MQILHNPIYAGAYAFARRGNRIRVEDGRARKTSGHDRPMSEWGALIRDNHEGYITWAEFEENQRMFGENAHMQKRASRKAARGGRALLTGLVRCGRCGRMMRVFYGAQSGHAHRYQCRGDDAHVGAGLCIGIGGVRVDQAVTALMLEAVSGHAVEAAMLAAERASATDDALAEALGRDLEAARYEASLAARTVRSRGPGQAACRARAGGAVERGAGEGGRARAAHRRGTCRGGVTAGGGPRRPAAARPGPARGLERADGRQPHPPAPHARPGPRGGDRPRRRDERGRGDRPLGGRAPYRGPRRAGQEQAGAPAEPARCPAEVVRRLAQEWPDREIAVTLNRMRCRTADGENWTSVGVREVRERLGIARVRARQAPRRATVGVQEVARRFGICIPSVLRLIREGTLPAEQAMPYAPWKIPADALASAPVIAGLRRVRERRPKNLLGYQRDATMRLPGL